MKVLIFLRTSKFNDLKQTKDKTLFVLEWRKQIFHQCLDNAFSARGKITITAVCPMYIWVEVVLSWKFLFNEMCNWNKQSLITITKLMTWNQSYNVYKEYNILLQYYIHRSTFIQFRQQIEEITCTACIPCHEPRSLNFRCAH